MLFTARINQLAELVVAGGNLCPAKVEKIFAFAGRFSARLFKRCARALREQFAPVRVAKRLTSLELARGKATRTVTSSHEFKEGDEEKEKKSRRQT